MEYIPLMIAAAVAVITAAITTRKPSSKEIWYKAGRAIVLLWVCSFCLHTLYLCV